MVLETWAALFAPGESKRSFRESGRETEFRRALVWKSMFATMKLLMFLVVNNNNYDDEFQLIVSNLCCSKENAVAVECLLSDTPPTSCSTSVTQGITNIPRTTLRCPRSPEILCLFILFLNRLELNIQKPFSLSPFLFFHSLQTPKGAGDIGW